MGVNEARPKLHRDPTAIQQAESTSVLAFELQNSTLRSPIAPRQAANGFLLTRDDLSASYAIIRHNVRTYRSAGVVEVVRGKQNAEAALKKFEASQDSPDRHEGWRYFLEKTELKSGTDPTEATDLRQADLEKRESKALEDTNPIPGSDIRDKPGTA
jgi:hypothetical protein